jgi:hypothetical protein
MSKFFRISPVRDSILQNYIKQEKGKESSLILDCKTRWNNLEVMIERFITLKECVVVALNDTGAFHMWNEAYYPKIIVTDYVTFWHVCNVFKFCPCDVHVYFK